jgi:hypothetical protein
MTLAGNPLSLLSYIIAFVLLSAHQIFMTRVLLFSSQRPAEMNRIFIVSSQTPLPSLSRPFFNIRLTIFQPTLSPLESKSTSAQLNSTDSNPIIRNYEYQQGLPS